MTLVAAIASADLAGVTSEHSRLQTNLSALQSFSGVIPTQEGGVSFTTPEIVDQRTRQVHRADHVMTSPCCAGGNTVRMRLKFSVLRTTRRNLI